MFNPKKKSFRGVSFILEDKRKKTTELHRLPIAQKKNRIFFIAQNQTKKKEIHLSTVTPSFNDKKILHCSATFNDSSAVETIKEPSVKKEKTTKKKAHLAVIAGLFSGAVGFFYAGIILGSIGILLCIVGIVKILKSRKKYTGLIAGAIGILIGLISVIGAIIVLNSTTYPYY